MSLAFAIDATFQFALFMFVQSTLLIAGVFLAVKLLRIRDAAVQSLFYRSTLIAVLVAPCITFSMIRSEVNGWFPSCWPGSMALPMAAESTTRIESSRPVVEPPAEDMKAGESVPSLTAIPERNPEILPAIDIRPVANERQTVGSLVVGSTTKPNLTFYAKTATCFAWLAISMVLLVRQWRAHRTLWKTLWKGVPAAPSIQSLCDQLSMDLGVRSPRVVCSPFFSSPFLAGIWSPVVHMPSDDIETESDDVKSSLRDVLIHELAHLKRADLLMRLINRLALTLFFFQPLLWKLTKGIENSAEDVCDDYAMSFGARRDRYAGRLVDLAERCDFPIGSAVGIASGKSVLGHRVARIMDHGRALSMQVSLRTAVLCLSLALLAAIFVGTMLAPVRTLTAQVPANSQATVSLQTDDAASSDDDDWPQDIIRGTVLDQNGPVRGAEVYWWRSRVYDFDPMAPVRVVTNEDGVFELTRTPPRPNDTALWDMREEMIIRAEGHAFQHTSPLKFGASIPANPDWPVQNGMREPIKLVAEGLPVDGRLVDKEGKPIANATVRIRWFTKRWFRKNGGMIDFRPPNPEPDTEEDLIRDVGSLVNTIEPAPLRRALPMAKTDADGRFQLTELPPDCLFELLVEREGIRSTNLVVKNYEGDEVETIPPQEGFEINPPTMLYPAEFQAIIEPSVAVTGTVMDAETGKPIVGAIVQTNIVAGIRMNSTRDNQHLSTITDERGHYRISGLPIGENEIIASATSNIPYIPIQSKANTSNAKDIKDGALTVDIKLKPGIWAEGRVYEPESNEPFQGDITYFWFRNKKLEATYPPGLFASLQGRYTTDSKGRYRIPVLPTPGIIAFDTGNRDHKRMAVYSRGFGEWELAKYRNADGNFPYYNTAPHIVMPGNYNRLALVDPKPNDKNVRVDMPLGKSTPIPVTILNPDGKPATGIMEIFGGNERFDWDDKPAVGFVVEDLLPDQKRKVFAFDRNRNLVGGTIVDHTKGKSFKIKLTEAGKVYGQLVDRNGDPFTNATITVVYSDSPDNNSYGHWARQVGKNYMPSELTIDESGRFEVHGLSSEWKYSARLRMKAQDGTDRIGDVIFRDLKIRPGEDRDLGDIVVKGE